MAVSGNPIGRLHVLTDFMFQQEMSHAELAEKAISGGADTIQFRQKHGTVRDMLDSLRDVADVCKASNVPLIVNDRLDLALAVNADGVHLGQQDLPLKEALQVVNGKMILGITAPSLESALAAQGQGATYVGFGPVYQTRSKSNPESIKGLSSLKSVASALKIPVIGIAGITPERCTEVIRHGAYGVAVMTAVSLSESPQSTCRLFSEAIESVLVTT